MPEIIAGQTFESLSQFKDQLRIWAVEEGFSPAILDSDARRVRVGCRTAPNCPFRVRCNFDVAEGKARVSILVPNHTCQDNQADQGPNILRGEVTKLRFLLDAVPQLMIIDQDTNTKDIIDQVRIRYGQTISIRQAQKVKSQLLATAAEQLGSHLWNKMKQKLGEDATDEEMRRGKRLRLDDGPDLRDTGPESADHRASESSTISSHFGERSTIAPTPDLGHEPKHHEMIDRVEKLESGMDQALGQAPTETAADLRAQAATLFQQASEKFREATQIHMQASKLFTQATELDEKSTNGC